MSEHLDEILSDCLDRLAGGEGVARCLDRYPEQRDRLASLLEAAAAAIKAVSAASPRPEARARGLSRLTTALADRGVPKPPRFAWLHWGPRYAMPVAIGVMAMLFTTGAAVGTGAAASDSVPGDPLYWVKTARENISLMVPRSDVEQAKAHIHLARVRGEEMGELMVKGKAAEAEKVEGRLNDHLSSSAMLVGLNASINPMETPYRPAVLSQPGQAEAIMAQLEQDSEFLRARLAEMVYRLPPGQRQRMGVLIRRSELGFRTLVYVLEVRSAPASGPFWRTEPQRPRRR